MPPIRGGASAAVVHTTDGGLNWAEQDLPTVEGLAAINSMGFVGQNDGVALGTVIQDDDGRGRPLAFATSDSGRTWSVTIVHDAVDGFRDVSVQP
jgi:photosystem II stability/assembly factor-like uncharacterized protein